MNHVNQLGAIGCGNFQAAAQGWQQPAEARLPEIRDQIDRLQREASEIESFIESMEARFHSILQPEMPKNEALVGTAPSHTPMGGELGVLVDRLRGSRRRLESMLQRAEL